jgi:hypothetical protein
MAGEAANVSDFADEASDITERDNERALVAHRNRRREIPKCELCGKAAEVFQNGAYGRFCIDCRAEALGDLLAE